jgi:hypothetical protein
MQSTVCELLQAHLRDQPLLDVLRRLASGQEDDLHLQRLPSEVQIAVLIVIRGVCSAESLRANESDSVVFVLQMMQRSSENRGKLTELCLGVGLQDWRVDLAKVLLAPLLTTPSISAIATDEVLGIVAAAVSTNRHLAESMHSAFTCVHNV